MPRKSAFLIGLVSGAILPAQEGGPHRNPEGRDSGSPASARLEAAPGNAREQSAGRFSGQPVKDPAGRSLGEVRDFLVHQRTGAIEWVVVTAAGMFNTGETLRLIPFARIQRPDGTGLRTDVRREAMERLPIVSEDHLELGHIAVTDTSVAGSTAAAGTQAPASGGWRRGEMLVPCGLVAGRPVQVGGREAGRIDAIVLDFESGVARALMLPARDFDELRRPVLVPFSQLVIAGKADGPVVTRLTRADFDHARR